MLPKHSRLLAYSDLQGWANFQYSATLAGKKVTLKETKVHVAPYYMTQLEVSSDATGTLIIYRELPTRVVLPPLPKKP